MKSLDISQKNFENQRAVVKEEYRMRVENAAYVPAAIRLEELVFQGYWPYEHPPIGTMRDLDAAQLDWVRASTTRTTRRTTPSSRSPATSTRPRRSRS